MDKGIGRQPVELKINNKGRTGKALKRKRNLLVSIVEHEEELTSADLQMIASGKARLEDYE